MRVIVDAMGGDHAPGAMISGSLLAADEFDLDMTLVGRQSEMEACLKAPENAELYKKLGQRVQLVDAPDVIDMHDNPATAVREKRASSMAVAIDLLKKGQGDVMVSAGSTGALLTGATLYAKRIRGIRRAALGTMLPAKGCQALLIDCGANVECTPEYLLQFAYMGSFYMEQMVGVQHPRIGLVNNGAESSKGGELQKRTYELLQRADGEGRLNFVGNIEGRDVMLGAADVVVCDGFTGNVLLKTVEGTAMYMMSLIKNMFYKSAVSKLAALLVKPGLREIKGKLDYKEVGGAPLLGIALPVIKAHGSADARAFRSAIQQAVIYTKADLIGRIEQNIDHMTVDEKTGKELEHAAGEHRISL